MRQIAYFFCSFFLLASKEAGAPKDLGLCHDVTPWTHHNRVSLCQATLSIGPYLLLKVQFQHHFITQISQLKPRWAKTWGSTKRAGTTEDKGKLWLILNFGFAISFQLARHRHHVRRAAHHFGHRCVLGVLSREPARHFLCALHMLQQFA